MVRTKILLFVFVFLVLSSFTYAISWNTTNQTDFDLGIYSNTSYNATISAVVLNATYLLGTYTSEIKNLTNASFNTISWTEGVPYQTELPDNNAVETVLGGVNMTGNVLLLHMNNDWSDSSGLENNGTASGATFTTSSKLGSHAGSFDGVDDYVNVSNTGGEFDMQTITVLAWIKLIEYNTSDFPTIISKRRGWGSGLASWELSMAPLYNFTSLRINGSSEYYINYDHNGNFPFNEWYYVGFTKNGANCSLYGNGVLLNSTTDCPDFNTGSNILIGQTGEDAVALSTYDFNGSIDEVAIWNRSLSADEILNIYKRGALRLNLSVRSCDDAACSGESWTDLATSNPSGETLTLDNNTFFQYKYLFDSNDTSFTPELYNVSLDYEELILCTDNDGDGFNVSKVGCGTVFDCDDTNSSVVPPLDSATYLSDVLFCNGTYTVDNMALVGMTATCNNTILSSDGVNSIFSLNTGAILQNCTFTGNEDRSVLTVIGNGTVRYNLFENFTHVDATGVDVYSIEPTIVNIYENTFNNNKGVGIKPNDILVSEVNIYNNVFIDGVECIKTENASNINITANSFSGCDYAIQLNEKDGTDGTTDSTIQDNNITDSKYNAITITLSENNTITGNIIYDNPTTQAEGFILSNQYLDYDGITFDGGEEMTLEICDDALQGGNADNVWYDGLSALSCYDGLTNVSIFLNDLTDLGQPNTTTLINGTYPSCAEVDAWWIANGVDPAPPCYFACVLYEPNGAGNNYTLNENCFNATVNISSGLTYPPYLNYGDIVNYAIFVDVDSTGNLIYNNNFSNFYNAFDLGTNDWNTTKTLGTNIIGGANIGGNYFNDYTGTDNNEDGIGDNPSTYTGTTFTDYLPLTNTPTGTAVNDCTNINTPGWYYLNKSIINTTTSYCMNISSNNVHFRCNDNTIMDANDVAQYGFYIYRAAVQDTNVTIENCNMNDWANYSIYAYRSRRMAINNTNITSSALNPLYLGSVSYSNFTNINVNGATASYGIYGTSISYNKFNNIISSGNRYGLYFTNSPLNNVTDSIIQNNTYWDMSILATAVSNCRGYVTNVTGTGNLPIVFYNGTTTIDGWNNNVSEIMLCNADNSVISNSNLSNTSSLRNNMILSVLSDNVTYENLTIKRRYIGVYSYYSNRSNFNNNLINYSASYNMYLIYGYFNNITNYTSILGTYGIYLRGANNTIKNSNITRATTRGAYVYAGIRDNYFYNNFFNNTNNIYATTKNYWNTSDTEATNIIGGTHTGGSYYATPTRTGWSQTCTNANGDSFCDAAYVYNNNNSDYLPLAMEDTTMPSGSILSPPNGTKVNGNVFITGTASDNVAISNVTFQESNESTGVWTNITGCIETAVYTCSWDTSGKNDGENWSVKIYPCDRNGNCNDTTEAKVYVIDKLAPIVDSWLVTYPENQTSIRNTQSVKLWINTTDGSGSGMNYVKANISLLNSTEDINMTLEGGSQATGEYSQWNLSAVLSGSATNLTTLVDFEPHDNATPTDNYLNGSFVVIVDNDVPTYDGLSVSDETPYINETIYFTVDAIDNYDLDSYIFSSNFSSVWVNDSTVLINGTSMGISINKSIGTEGTYGWMFYFIDDAGNMNQTDEQTLVVSGTQPTMTVILTYPEDSSTVAYQLFNYTYHYDEGVAVNCSLYINDTLNTTNSSPTAGDDILVELPMNPGAYSYFASCYDFDNEVYVNSSVFNFTVDLCTLSATQVLTNVAVNCGDEFIITNSSHCRLINSTINATRIRIVSGSKLSEDNDSQMVVR